MATILAFAGSNSSTSINFQWVKHTVSMIEGHEVKLLDMATFPFPMYSADYEKQYGHSDALVALKEDIVKADGLIISVNEHNSNPSAYFKNLIDWLSRTERKFLHAKPILLMSTSGGKRGGAGALEVTKNLLPRFGAEIVATFPLPSFHENLDGVKGVVNPELAKAHAAVLEEFLAKL